MKQIGKGAFTTAYKKDASTVLLKSVDPIKECMAHGWFPNSQLFPNVKFGERPGEYVMRYYNTNPSLTKLHPKHRKFYDELHDLWTSLPLHSGYNEVYQAFTKIKDRNYRRIMVDALQACSNYGSDVCFEISPRNIAITKTGRMVLLDCFFMRSKLREVRG